MLFSVYGRWRFRTRTRTRWVRGKLSGSRISRCVSNRKWEYSGVNKCDSAPLMLPESLSVYMPQQSRGQFGFIWSTSLLIPGVSRVERDMRSIWRASDPYKYTAKADWRVREEGKKKQVIFRSWNLSLFDYIVISPHTVAAEIVPYFPLENNLLRVQIHVSAKYPGVIWVES